MAQYIDKAAVVAEIKKLQLCTMDEHMNYYSAEAQGEYNALSKLGSFLDTFEVKEVDLEKEIEDWVKTGPHTSCPWCTIPDAIRITAEYFFELGLWIKCKQVIWKIKDNIKEP